MTVVERIRWPRAISRARAFAWTLTALLALAGVAEAADPTFDAWWHDGRAELDGYRLQVTRYGAPRRAQAVMVYVTEPFSLSRHVKLDYPRQHSGDAVDVMKLNLVRDFQTGIYDYNTMMSLFVRSSDFEPLKVSFSGAEWCGHVYEELNFGSRTLDRQTFSYFDGETGTATLRRAKGGITEDALYVLLRGLRGPWLEPGERRRVPFLPGPFVRRLVHQPLAWGTAVISRRAGPVRVTVPAGAFDADAYDVQTSDGRRAAFEIERAYPHRIVRWRWSRSGPKGSAMIHDATETGVLTGTLRVKYWDLHAPGDERYLKSLGLEPTVR